MNIELRIAEKNDCLQLFEWVNDPDVRMSSFAPDKISFDDHLVWFDKHLHSRNCWIYIALSSFGEAVGQIRFDEVGAGVAEVDVSVDGKYRGQGLGVGIIEAGIKQLWKQSDLSKAVAAIKKQNISSYKAFLRAGFKVSNSNSDCERDCHCLVSKRFGNEGS